MRGNSEIAGNKSAAWQPGLFSEIQACLRRVVGVDVDILDRQVGGPEEARACALMKLDRNGELALLHVSVRTGLVKLGGAPTVATDGQIAKRDVEAVRGDLRAGVADGGGQAAPVGIATGPGRFHQRRVGDRFCDAERVRV